MSETPSLPEASVDQPIFSLGAVEELDDLQAVGAGGLGGGEIGGGEVAGFGEQGLVELAGALRLP